MGRQPLRGRRGGRADQNDGPRWVIDTYGLIAVFQTASNAVRNAVIEAIQNGSMRILRPAGDELRNAYEQLYDDLQHIRPKRYFDVTIQAQAAAAVMMDTYGASPLGGMPMYEHFEAIAVATVQGCELVSADRALRQYRRICDRCEGRVINVNDFA